MKGLRMRTVLASLALTITSAAMAHEGHGESAPHWHGGDLMSIVAMVFAVGLWLWFRNEH
jgi:hypothetical protein